LLLRLTFVLLNSGGDSRDLLRASCAQQSADQVQQCGQNSDAEAP